MDIVAALGLEVDSRPVARADTALDRFKRSAGGAERSAIGFERAGRGMAAASIRIAAGLGAAAASFLSLRAASGAAQAYTEMTNGLRALGATSEEAASQLEDIAGIASRTRTPLAATAQLYQRISIAGRDLGVAQQDVYRFTENVGLALAQSGASASSAAGSLLQLSQAMSGGTVRAEEFNSILEGAFPIAQAAANGIDGAAGSVGRLRQMVIAGQVSSEEFFDAILSQTDALERAFASTVPTISQAMQTLGDRFTLVIGQFDTTAGISEAVARGILRIADAVQAIGNSAAVQMLAENMDTLGYIAATVATIFVGRLVISIGTAFVAATISAVQQTIALQIALGATSTSAAIAGAAITTLSRGLILLRGALIATGIGALVVGIGVAINQFTRVVAATGSFGAALSLLWQVAVEVWDGIKTSASAVVPALNAVWIDVKAGFFDMVSSMQLRWFQFLVGISQGLLSAGMESAARRVGQVAESAGAAFDSTAASVSEMRAQADGLREDAANLVASGLVGAADALHSLSAVIAENEAQTTGAANAAEEFNTALGSLAAPDGGAAAAGAALDEASTRAEAFNAAMADAADTAEEFGTKQANIMIRGVDSVSNAFGDWIANGFRDFRSFADSIVNTFKQMLAQMIALAVRNRIMIGLGFSGGGVAAAGQAVAGATGGGGSLLGNIFGLGGGGGILGSFGSGGSILGMSGLGGGSGLLGGLGNALSGGIGNLFSFGANAAAAGGGIAATIGAALPVIGIAAAAFSLLKTKTKQVNDGLHITVDEMGVLAEQFKTIKKVRAFGGRSYSTYYSDADAETQAFVEQTVGQLQAGVIASAEALGIATDAFDGFATAFDVSFYGKSEEEAQAALEAALYGMADSMASLVPGLQDFTNEGEGAYDALTRLASSLTSVNFWMGNLGLAVQEIGLAGGAAASNFVDLFGSIDAFNSAAQSYYQNFYSDSERLRRATELLSVEFAALGMDVMPTTRHQFRDLVDAADAAGDTELVAALIQLSPAFADITQEVNALDQALNGQSMFRTLADQVYADTSDGYRKSISQVLDEAGDEAAQLLREVVTAIREGDLNNARIQSKLLAIQQRAELDPVA